MHIHEILEEDQDVALHDLQKQFNSLFLKPFQRIIGIRKPILLIIDALDECKNEDVTFLTPLPQHVPMLPCIKSSSLLVLSGTSESPPLNTVTMSSFTCTALSQLSSRISGYTSTFVYPRFPHRLRPLRARPLSAQQHIICALQGTAWLSWVVTSSTICASSVPTNGVRIEPNYRITLSTVYYPSSLTPVPTGRPT